MSRLGINFREVNAQIKDLRRITVQFGLCYPSTYRAGMTSLAIHLFYSLLNQREDTSCERYFRYDVTSPSHSVETLRPLRQNHIVGFSLTYEEDIIHLLQMLENGQIPVMSSERTSEDPLVIVGGPVVTANPEPFVDFVDAFVIGDGEYVIHPIVDSVAESSSRSEALERISELEGVYVPIRRPDSVRRLVVEDLDSAFHPTAQVMPDVPTGDVHEPIFGKSLLVEMARGCRHACAFCIVGHICRPWRARSLERLQEIIEQGLLETPVKKVALIGSTPESIDNMLDRLAIWIVDRGLELSLPSLRADVISRELVDALVRGGQRTLTLAPESGSEKLRDSMRKGLLDEDIDRAVELAKQAGIRALKLYFIIGLPGETEDDVRSIATMVRRLRMSSSMRVTVSVNPFIPKAGTRLEREPQRDLQYIRRMRRMIESELKGLSHVEIESFDPRAAQIQAALSIGDRSLGRLIRLASYYGGLGGWRRAERETGVSIEKIACSEERQDGILPWSFIRY